MDSPRTRSDDRARPGYGIRRESKTTPNGFRGSRNPGRDGKGRDRQLGNPRDAGFSAEAFAAHHFPDETVGIEAAVHRAFIQNGRKPPKPEAVQAIMEAKGWTLAQRRAAL